MNQIAVSHDSWNMLALRLLSCSLTATGPCQKEQRAEEGQKKASGGQRHSHFLLTGQSRFGQQATRQMAEEAYFHLIQQGNNSLNHTKRGMWQLVPSKCPGASSAWGSPTPLLGDHIALLRFVCPPPPHRKAQINHSLALRFRQFFFHHNYL